MAIPPKEIKTARYYRGRANGASVDAVNAAALRGAPAVTVTNPLTS
jgi:hypothetical protein